MDVMEQKRLYEDAVGLLRQLIATPSPSREEKATADIVQAFMEGCGIAGVNRIHNNVWAVNRHFDPVKPTILLNSHHDTVKPNQAYTRDPYSADMEDGRLYGLGSNDAGASVVSLLALFRHYYEAEGMKYNLAVAITGEEEVSGTHGVETVVPLVGNIEFVMVGEPTRMQLAVAERGLLVLDCVARGKAGHAAREEGDNAIYHAVDDINWFRTFRFPKVSPLLGPVKTSVTIIGAGTQHNVVPAECRYTVDVRFTEQYTNLEVIDIIRQHVSAEVTPRSTRLKSSSMPLSHPIVAAGLSLGLTTFGSPTSSDQALLSLPSLKVGPGDSARSHSADEYVVLAEIEQGIHIYIKMLGKILF